jgi:cysteinyl-tRNA synthetase
MANYWLHNGFLQVEGEKMSKSLGNFITIHELLKDWPGEVVRLNMLRTHYRQPMDWTVRGLKESEQNLHSWFDTAEAGAGTSIAPAVLDALLDDMNTPKAIAEIHALHAKRDGAALGATLATLGFKRSVQQVNVDEAKVGGLIAQRAAARKAKDFKESDRIRDELAAMGVVLKDGKDPKTGEPTTTWEVAR